MSKILNITLIRDEKYSTCTMGKLYLNDSYFCDTLEDIDRGLYDTMSLEEIKSKKVYGETAIPYGKYKVVIDYSNKYKKMMPHILNVKGFEGIRMHNGSFNADTYGCPLLGRKVKENFINQSRDTFKLFMDKLQGYDEIWLEIKEK